MKTKEVKTNAMRILDKEKIAYTYHTYECNEFVDGVEIASTLNQPLEKVYKTLVTKGNDNAYYVFVVPVAMEIDLKKAARAVGVKSVAMIHVKDLFPLTGYVRGGCTSIGMKKQFVTCIDQRAKELESIIVSGGRLGLQIELKPTDLVKACKGKYDDIAI